MTNGNGIVCMVDRGRPVISSFSADVVWPVVGLEGRPEQQQAGSGSFSLSKPTGCL